MATAKTGSFYLTETVTIPAASAAGTRVQGVIDLGAYVNVATSQAIAIESVDFVTQGGADLGLSFSLMLGGTTNLSEAFMVVNDSLYLVAGPDQAPTATDTVFVTARIRCRVAKLSSKDWMAIAIQSTASDN